jgi:pimeloyl-ACP methyl ester carboxylesterase
MRPSPALAGTLLAALIFAACSGQPAASARGDASQGSSTAAQSPATTTAASPAELPVSSLDPGMSAADLFADDSPAADIWLEERSSETRDGALIRDIRFAGADGREVSAYLIGPATGSPKTGVLFLHWLGERDSSREEFVDEAIALAAKGVASMLIQQRFPWAERPSGADHDRVAIGYEVRNARRALTLLAAAVGPGKLAIVGHDFGGMHGLLAASVDRRVVALVCMAPTASWADWFVRYFHVVPASEAPAYGAAMADLDPVARLPEVTAALLLQFAESDVYVPSSVVEALTNAAPDGTEVRAYDTGHRMDEAARTERDAWVLDKVNTGG